MGLLGIGAISGLSMPAILRREGAFCSSEESLRMVCWRWSLYLGDMYWR
jgi:hypothetical protein